MKDGELKIEKGIPIPVGTRKVIRDYSNFKVGDSVFFKTLLEAEAFRLNARYHGFHVARRAVEGGQRVWRTK